MTGTSDTEDDALNFDFLNSAGTEMLQWSEKVRKLLNGSNVTKSKLSEVDKKSVVNCLFEGYQVGNDRLTEPKPKTRLTGPFSS